MVKRCTATRSPPMAFVWTSHPAITSSRRLTRLRSLRARLPGQSQKAKTETSPPGRSAHGLDWLRRGKVTAVVGARVAVGTGVATGALLQIFPDLAEHASELHGNHECAARAGADGFQAF